MFIVCFRRVVVSFKQRPTTQIICVHSVVYKCVLNASADCFDVVVIPEDRHYNVIGPVHNDQQIDVYINNLFNYHKCTSIIHIYTFVRVHERVFNGLLTRCKIELY